MNNNNRAATQNVDVSERFPLLERARGVVVADGIGIRIRVHHGELVISDGVGRFRRERVFSRVNPPNRVVIVGNAGSLTLESIHWLRDLRVGVLHLDRGGQPLMVSIPEGRNDARIRRAQANAAGNEVGVEIARYLLGLKIRGQRDAARTLTDDSETLRELESFVESIEAASTLTAVRQLEAAAASLYWSCWTSLEPRFVTRDRSRIPAHWTRFSTRRSLVSKTPRLATDPINALLNMLYGMGETEALFACVAIGCDPYLGIVHMDTPRRASFALDVLEAVRPQIDSYVLRLLKQPLRLRDFHETREGVCRVLPPLSHHLAGTMPEWARTLAPIVEGVAEFFVAAADNKIDRLSTPLTQRNRRRAHGRDRSTQEPSYTPTMPPRACRRCGEILSGGRTVCDECLPALKQEQVQDMLKRSKEKIIGRPRPSEARKRQSATMQARNRQVKEWNSNHPDPIDRNFFLNEVLPGLSSVPVRAIARATGLSSRYASQIRKGREPHARHWPVLKSLAESYEIPSN